MSDQEYLTKLFLAFDDAIQSFEGYLKSATVESEVVEDFARELCLAGRSTYSEFRALVFDNDPMLPSIVPDIRAKHERAVAVFRSVHSPTAHTLAFLDATEARLHHINTIRIVPQAGTTRVVSGASV